MREYTSLSKDAMREELKAARAEYAALKAKDQKLDMSRGKPNPAQLDLSMDMLALEPTELVVTRKGTDVRNYGELAGVDECKELFADLLGLQMKNIIMGGQSSLNLMYDSVVRALLLGVYGGSKPWGAQGELKFLCPVPGYDRHFAICETFGIKMINIPLGEYGPDMDLVRQYVEHDASVKGIWCVPKYSNPTGITYSDEVVRAFAALKPAADDFRIFWDNAYLVHSHGVRDEKLLNIFDACREYGSEDMVYEFCSTSKITFSGAGLAVLAASENNVKFILQQMKVQTIGYDKINQLRHVKYFENVEGIYRHMQEHAALMRPKFNVVLGFLDREIAPRGIARWQKPKGGYFVSVNTMPGIAKATWKLCKEAGLTMTGAGATFPYGKDPQDSNLRVAPSLPPIEQLEQAMEILCISMRLAALEKLLG